MKQGYGSAINDDVNFQNALWDFFVQPSSTRVWGHLAIQKHLSKELAGGEVGPFFLGIG